MKLALADHMSDAGLEKWIAALGVVSAPVPRANVREALSFFQSYIARLDPAMALNFLRATDVSKRVRRVLLQPNERLIAFRSGAETQFKLFFTRAGQSKHSSGVNPEGREAAHFTVRTPVMALESYAAPAIDTWTRLAPGQRSTVAPRANSAGYMASGGGLQLIVPESYGHLLVKSHGP